MLYFSESFNKFTLDQFVLLPELLQGDQSRWPWLATNLLKPLFKQFLFTHQIEGTDRI
jgi:hypothetical protein